MNPNLFYGERRPPGRHRRWLGFALGERRVLPPPAGYAGRYGFMILPEHSRSITHTLSLSQPLAGSGKADVEPLLEHSRGASLPGRACD